MLGKMLHQQTGFVGPVLITDIDTQFTSVGYLQLDCQRFSIVGNQHNVDDAIRLKPT